MSITTGSSLTRTSSPITPNSSSSSSTKGNGNGNTQACAACKYQRRKCAPDCILAPYFPHDKQRQFLNAHKLFGVKKITRSVEKLDHSVKDDAMRAIMFQSDARASDPVGGCYRIIQVLHRLIEYNEAELDVVLQQVAICRAQAQQQQIAEAGDTIDHLSLYGNPMHFHYLEQANDVQVAGQQDLDVPYAFVQNGNGNGHQQHLEADDIWAMPDSMSLYNKHGMNSGDSEDIKTFVDIPCDDGQRNHDIKFQPDAMGDQSDEALLKRDNGNLKEDRQTEPADQEVLHHHQDLKGEAALFMTLTNCSSLMHESGEIAHAARSSNPLPFA